MAEINSISPTLKDKDIARFWSKVKRDGPEPEHVPGIGPCWIWQGTFFSTGYGVLHLSDNGKKSMVLAHRIAWMLSSGQWPSLNVLHKCDRKSCLNPSHLFLGTLAENCQDRARKGRSARGDRHASKLHPELIPRGVNHKNSKVTDEIVREIRRLDAAFVPHPTIAEKFNITTANVWYIANRHTWKHVN